MAHDLQGSSEGLTRSQLIVVGNLRVVHRLAGWLVEWLDGWLIGFAGAGRQVNS